MHFSCSLAPGRLQSNIALVSSSILLVVYFELCLQKLKKKKNSCFREEGNTKNKAELGGLSFTVYTPSASANLANHRLAHKSRSEGLLRKSKRTTTEY